MKHTSSSTSFEGMFLLLFSRPDSLWPRGQHHARLPSPLPSPKVCPSLCSLLWWCHPAISSSDAFFSFCHQSFPASGTFPLSQLFASDDQNTRASASATVLPMNIQGWFPIRLTGLIFLLSKGLSRVFCTPQFKGISYSELCLLYGPALTTIHDHWEDHGLDYTDVCRRVMSLLFNTLSRSVMASLPRNDHLLTSWLQSPSTVILEPKKRKSVTTSTFSLSICSEVMGLDPLS